jgi:hypothetical protein
MSDSRELMKQKKLLDFVEDFWFYGGYTPSHFLASPTDQSAQSPFLRSFD